MSTGDRKIGEAKATLRELAGYAFFAAAFAAGYLLCRLVGSGELQRFNSADCPPVAPLSIGYIGVPLALASLLIVQPPQDLKWRRWVWPSAAFAICGALVGVAALG